jgi:release factor glutamine methyltransferase
VTRSELIGELAATLGAPHEARFIADEVLGSTGTLSGADEVAPETVAVARAMAARRQSGEPLQYIFGHWSFRALDLLVDPRVLIPRPETEQVVEVALAELRRLGVQAGGGPTIVDAGTGSGAIALSLAVELASGGGGGGGGGGGEGGVWATDASADALVVARANEARVRRCAGGALLPVEFVHGSWLADLPSALTGAVDLVVSNPPYVDEAEWEQLPTEVRLEPRQALVAPSSSGDGDAGGVPGLGDVEEVLVQSRHWLSSPGAVVIELAPHQADAASALAQRLGYVDVRVDPDLSGRARALVGRTR